MAGKKSANKKGRNAQQRNAGPQPNAGRGQQGAAGQNVQRVAQPVQQPLDSDDNEAPPSQEAVAQVAGSDGNRPQAGNSGDASKATSSSANNEQKPQNTQNAQNPQKQRSESKKKVEEVKEEKAKVAEKPKKDGTDVIVDDFVLVSDDENTVKPTKQAVSAKWNEKLATNGSAAEGGQALIRQSIEESLHQSSTEDKTTPKKKKNTDESFETLGASNAGSPKKVAKKTP